ncbi:hypothetical protein QJS10_CPB04g01758 [Acorus calamus]|uniref:Uncharacterized protein n=1 Tax=Acorus calamus TaxID=4465 RepID=A0AAV9EY33_ACOCL|nr:hypothetical protein QJS10_CPB04g01758 [Acorus calamus]
MLIARWALSGLFPTFCLVRNCPPTHFGLDLSLGYCISLLKIRDIERMRSVEDKPCYSHGSETTNSNTNSSRGPPHRAVLGKPTPSKWDDAQKWLAGLGSDAGSRQSKASKPRNSNAEDRRLLAPSLSQKGRDSCSSVEGCVEDIAFATKKIDCNGWGANGGGDKAGGAFSVCERHRDRDDPEREPGALKDRDASESLDASAEESNLVEIVDPRDSRK